MSGATGALIGSAVVGAAGTAYSANQQSKAAKNAANAATYRGANINSPFGNVTSTQGPGGQFNYNVTDSPYTPFIPQLSALSQGAFNRGQELNNMGPLGALQSQAPDVYGALQGADAQGAQTQGAFQQGGADFRNLASLASNRFMQSQAGGGPLEQAGLGILGRAQGIADSVNPGQVSQDVYGQLSALARPGETSATQNMFNNLQSSGRLGLSQNGELGDLGGLGYAQNLANNQRSLQSLQYGNDLYAQRQGLATNMAGLAPSFFAQDASNRGQDALTLQGLLQSALNSEGNAFSTSQNRFGLAASALGLGSGLVQDQINLGGFGLNQLGALQGNYNQNINQAIAAGGAQSGAGANAGQFMVNGANQQANMLGGFTSGLLGAANNYFGARTGTGTTGPSIVPQSAGIDFSSLGNLGALGGPSRFLKD